MAKEVKIPERKPKPTPPPQNPDAPRPEWDYATMRQPGKKRVQK